MYREVIRSSVPDAVMSIVIVLLGAFMILYWLIGSVETSSAS